MPRSAAAPIPTEYQEQVAVIDWWAVYAPTRGIPVHLLLAIPNGAYLGADARMRAMVMNKLKRSGLRVGVPDLFLAVTRPCFSGLWLEMKRRKGSNSSLSIDQVTMLGDLRRQDYSAVVCYGADEAIRAIQAYLDPLVRERVLTPQR